MAPLRILALEPYLARSHEQFLDGLARHSKHDYELWTLPPRKWKWRMRTSALHFAERLISSETKFDAILASDYVNLAELRALLPTPLAQIPTAVYFHENQLTYPLQEGEFLDYQFAMTHLYSMLVADRVVFNSEYHRCELLAALRPLLKLVPDLSLVSLVDEIEAKTSVLPLGIDHERPPQQAVSSQPTIVWNHRWEYDKNPRPFLDALLALDRGDRPFRVRLLGQRFRSIPSELRTLLERLEHRIISSEYPEDRNEYLSELSRGDIAVSTAIHEFFGLGILEALRAGLHPVLPNALAYPELLPPGERDDRYLYDPREGPLETLSAAIDRVQSSDWSQQRRVLALHTDSFEWRTLARRYDDLMVSVAGGAIT